MPLDDSTPTSGPFSEQLKSLEGWYIADGLLQRRYKTAGWPVMSNGAVFGSISNARWVQRARSLGDSGIGVAFIGVVGISSRS